MRPASLPAAQADLLAGLEALQRETRGAAEAFLDRHGDEVEIYRGEITRAVDGAVEELARELAEISGDSSTCASLVEQASKYVSWLQWTFWDLPYFAVALSPPLERFRRGVATCGMVYTSIRIFDDVLDRHFWYKARRPTLLTIFDESGLGNQKSDGLTTLAALLLTVDGLFRLSDSEDALQAGMLRRLLSSYRRAVVGAIMENADRGEWSPAYYDRLVELKNVDFWRCLYTAVDADWSSPLYPFLERYYTLAQKLNDVQDFSEDEQRGQPNLISVHLGRAERGEASEPWGRVAPAAVESLLAQDFLELGRLAGELPETEAAIARLKLGESLEEARRLGLFGELAADGNQAPEAPEEPPPGVAALSGHSRLEEIVETCGTGALERVACEVCGGDERAFLFEKQGFSFHRCSACTHIYVSPRPVSRLRTALGEEPDRDAPEDPFMEVQRIYAEPICYLLRSRAPGPRLLDLGFGHGHLLRLVRAYGFEVYGVDSSRGCIEMMQPELGKRAVRASLELDEIPWGSFDAVVMSHVLEHLPAPGDILEQVLGKLVSGGILYISVPDMESLQFRIFGKGWDIVHPLVHLQYFTEASLTRLLEDRGFVGVERVTRRALPDALLPRWARLMRRLGGEESGELAVLARRPGPDDETEDQQATADAEEAR